MNPEQRITELEAQVRALTGLVHRLLQAREPGEHVLPDHRDPQLVDKLQRSVSQSLQERPDTHEFHIGAVWLSRTSVVLLVGFLALGTRALVAADALEAWQKVGVGFGLGALLLASGIYLWRHHDVFAEGFLGTGLGLLYLAAFAAVVPPSLRLVPSGNPLPYLLLAAMAGMLTASWWFRSQTVAVLAALAGYGTACWAAGTTGPGLQYVLPLCGLVAGATFLLHFSRGWLTSSWTALAGTHICLQLAVARPEPLDYGALYLLEQTPDYSLGFVLVFALCYLFLTAGFLSDFRESGRYHRSVATMGALNSLLFVRLAWPYAEARLSSQAWVFWATLGALWLGCAILAERRGRSRNHVFPLFLTKAVVAFTIALAVYLQKEWFLAAVGLEGLVLAIAYKRTGVVFLKLLGIGLVVTATLVALVSVRDSDLVMVGSYLLPRSLVAAAAMALSFSVTAAFHERYVRWVRPEERHFSGQWWLADSPLNWRGASIAIAHASAAAFVLVATSIFQYGDDPRLPYLLAGEALAFAILGVVLLTPQLEVGCIFLLMAAHLCYHVFIWMPMPGFEEQAHYLPLTLGLALFTYVGAYLWERYVRLFHAIGPEWEHYLLVTGPYLAATAMLAILIWREVPPVYVPGALAGLALALLGVGWLTGFPGIKGSAVLAIAAGSAAMVHGLRQASPPLSEDPRFPAQILVYLIACLCSERLVRLTQHWNEQKHNAEDHVRTLLVAVPAATGIYAVVSWSKPGHAVLFLLAHGAAAIGFSALFREARYRWAALLILAFAIVFGVSQWMALSLPAQLTAFAGAWGVLLALWWLLAHFWLRKEPRRPAEISHDA